MRQRSFKALVALVALASCQTKSPTAPLPPHKESMTPPAPEPGLHHTLRLAWAGWKNAHEYLACGRRTGELTDKGRLGKCLAVTAVGQAPVAREWTDAVTRDESAVASAPMAGGCHVHFTDAQGAPGSPAAVASLMAANGKNVDIASWQPRPEDNGDQFALETSFSPDGTLLAITRVAIGIGEGETSVDVLGVELRAAPACP